MTISSGGINDLTLDSGSDTLIIADATLQRSASGSTTLDLFDASGSTTFNIINSSGAQVADLSVEGDVTAVEFNGSGAGLTTLNATNISSGTIADGRLSTNVVLLDQNQTFTGVPTFNSGLVLGNTASTTAGTIRWTGADFEGYDGSGWVSFTSATSSTAAAATFYDSAGGATIGTSFATINLDATLDNSDPSVVDVASDIVTVQEDGYYEISYSVTAELASGTRSGFNAKLQLDTGSGFNDVAGSQSYHYGRVTTETQGTSSATVILDLSAGDDLRIQGQGTSESFTTIANATNLTISSVIGGGGGGGGGGTSFDQGGNAFGAKGILGTTDSFGLDIVTNGSAAIAIDSSGAVDVNNGLTIVSGNLSVDSGVIDSTAGLTIQSGGAGDIEIDSATDLIIISDTTLQFTGTGTTTFDLFDNSAGTTFEITNSSGAQVAGLSVEGAISATSFSGDGSGLTSLDGSQITTGTIPNARLSADVVLTTGSQTFTGVPTFSSGLVLGNSASTTAGAIRWSGTDFEGFNGTSWVSLTTDPSSPLLDGVLAFGKVDGTTGNPLNVDGASTSRSGTGSYTVTLDTTAANANYTVQLTVEEDSTTRDDINITLDNQTTGGFDVTIREGDNSTTADVLIDEDWHFIVFDPEAAAGGGGGGGTSFVDGGNGFGANAVIGTTDTYGLTIITDNSAALTFTSGGDATFAQDVRFNGLLTVGTLGAPDALSQLSVATGAASNKGLVIQGDASQTANLLEFQDNSGNILAAFEEDGGLVLGRSTALNGEITFLNDTNSNTLTLDSTAVTGARVVSLPDATGVICLEDSTDCGFLTLATGLFVEDATTNDTIAINKTGASGNIIALQKSGTAVFTVANTGSLQIQRYIIDSTRHSQCRRHQLPNS